ncbi:solute carrier family 25 member 47-B isoform X1 [Esox lucius]|uniref:Solute carrier family 25 member 47 n=2 Tax=Esox lucius TaxID=8010 RepID=A0A3P9A5L6_ESOLU|nr:solute carrier family 25 member 47-B isoform X1 [Esox lucius]XP_034153175.1 solute carrier family 25 member 47-B isoform X1 [Esox lucius]
MHLADFAAGSVGGAFGVAVGYPLDTIKVRIQTQRRFTGVWQCIRTTWKTEGVNGFYRGMSMPVTTVSISSSVVFGVYRNVLQCFRKLRSSSARLDLLPAKVDIFLSGFSGGVAQVSVMAPADIVKVRMQCQMVHQGMDAQQPKYRGPVHCLLTIARKEGILGLYKGAGALALRDGPSFATYFTVYHVICEQLSPPGESRPEWKVVLLAGGLSGMCGWCIGTPMDVIKSRLQVDGMGKRRYNGFFHCIGQSVRTEGLGVLFKGLGLNCVRAFPVNMSVFAMYEVVVRLLRQTP